MQSALPIASVHPSDQAELSLAAGPALVAAAIFDGAVVAVRYLDGRRARRGITLGSCRSADLPCDEELLAGPRHQLVRRRGAGYEVAIPDGLAGSFRDPHGVHSLQALRASGLLIPAEDEPGVSLFVMPQRGELTLTLGLVQVVLTATSRPVRVPARRWIEGTVLAPVAALWIVAAMIAVMVAALPPEPKPLLILDGMQLRLSQVPRLARLQLVMPQLTWLGGASAGSPAPQGAARPVPRGEGPQGRAPSGERTGAPLIRRPTASQQPPGSQLASEPAEAPSDTQPGPRALMQALLAGSSLGEEAESTLGALTAAPAGADSGQGSAGLAGSGRAAQGEESVQSAGLGRTEGSAAGQRLSPRSDGSFGLHGSGPGGSCLPPGCDGIGLGIKGYGGRGAGVALRHVVKDDIDLVMCGGRMCAPERSGTYREGIRRVIKQHLNEIRFCYERGLLQDPALTGRVVIRFRFNPAGLVTESTLAETTLPGREVGTCITEAFRRWLFPAMNTDVEVTYPINLRVP